MRALVLALLLAGCVPLNVDPSQAGEAQRQWGMISDAPVKWTVVRCVGLPAAMIEVSERGVARGTMWQPWGCGAAAMRYEMSKIAWVVHAPDWLVPLAMIDAMFHLPPSEIHSWLWVFGGRNE